MDLQCEATIERQDEEYAWLHWSLAPSGGGTPIAEGRVRYDLETVQFHWEEGRPPSEHTLLVRATVDRAVRGRKHAAGNS
jgi:hypothetical protein